jgi:predicted enzyme related to lactoylglutathione lyase
MKLMMVELYARNWTGVVDWYRHTLGLRVLLRVDEDGYALLEADGVQLAIKALDGPNKSYGEDKSRPTLYFLVPDLEAELRRLSEQGVPLVKPLKVTAENYRRVVIADPEGQPICLFDWIKQEEQP